MWSSRTTSKPDEQRKAGAEHFSALQRTGRLHEDRVLRSASTQADHGNAQFGNPLHISPVLLYSARCVNRLPLNVSPSHAPIDGLTAR
jgi:hypothetical protein